MRFSVIGCHGGETPRHLNTCFRIDDSILLEAGSPTRGLSITQQVAIDHVIVSHGHLDHIGGLDNFCWPNIGFDPKANPDGKLLVLNADVIAGPLYKAPMAAGRENLQI